MRSQVLPWVPPESRRILDLGCGDGRILTRVALAPDSFPVGVDIDLDNLRAAKSLFPSAHFVCARGEQLPFRSRSFDSCICGVALPYMDIPRALVEVRRVLKTQGSFWASLHSFRMARRHWLRSVVSLDLKDIIFRAYVLVNGALFFLTGNVFRFPLKRDRIESFQSRTGMRKALRAAGFIEEEIISFFAAGAVAANEKAQSGNRSG